MARTKETFPGKYVPESARAEGKGQIAFNLVVVEGPQEGRIIRAVMSTTEVSKFINDLTRSKERANARQIFNLGE